jgi:hypothetical protein
MAAEELLGRAVVLSKNTGISLPRCIEIVRELGEKNDFSETHNIT